NSLRYGDDILYKALESIFLYIEMDLNCMYEQMLANEMKDKFYTLDEANLFLFKAKICN
ncbi:19513_t:CDS:1, partial [Gigaspora rosea]